MKTLILCTALLWPIAAQADTIQIPLGQQGDKQIERPTLGMSKAQVEQRFGEPLTWTEATGEPPISSWEYKDFKVYFEHEHVIHAVLKHKKNH